MVKKFLKKVLAGSLAACVVFTSFSVPVHAGEIDPSAIAVGVGTTVKTGFQNAVAWGMQGRSGAYTETGAKGIALEVIEKGKMNAENVWNGAKTQFTKAANATQVDLVTIKDGKVVERIQCKNLTSKSGINKTISAVKEGKYQQTQIHGTTECAAAFNEKAVAEGLTKTMVDTGITEDMTIDCANRFLKKLPTAKSVVNNVKAGAAFGAAIDGGMALVESIQRGDDVYEATANVTVATGEGVVTGVIATASGEAIAAILAVTTSAGIVSVIVPVVGAVVIGQTVSFAYDHVIKENHVEEYVAEALRIASEDAVEMASNLNLQEKSGQVVDAVKAEASNVQAVIITGAGCIFNQ